MPENDAILSLTVRLDLGGATDPAQALRSDSGITLELDGDRRVRLDPGDERSVGYARVLAQLAEYRQPVYVELDDDDTIARLLLPRIARLKRVRELGNGGIEYELQRSHARLSIQRDHPRFDEFAEGLNGALRDREPRILTLDDRGGLVDLRAFKPGPDGPFPEPPDPLPDPDFPRLKPWWSRWFDRIIRWHYWPWRWFSCPSLVLAQQVFDSMSALSCDPLTVPSPCIPFLYPDDGCWGRAHEMARLMIQQGLSPRKVWIRGSLHVDTSNHPNCGVNWGWHVAPTLCTRCGIFLVRTMVIDPSLFSGPVTATHWKSVQGDPSATLNYTAPTVFIGSSSDPTYTSQIQVLSNYRLALQTRSINNGPPPYPCP